MKNSILLSFILVFLMACGNGEDHSNHKSKAFDKTNLTEDEKLRNEVMEGHDIGMAKINTLSKTKDQLIKIIDSLDKNKVTITNDLKASMKKAVADLDDAYKEMFKWMEEYKDDSAKNDLKARLEYLKKEKISVEIVKDKIFSSLAYADSVLAETLK